MKRIRALLAKELLLETRQQYSFYGLLLYIGTTLFVLFMAIDQPEAAVWNGLFWVNLLFICINAVSKSFLQESRGRMLYFYTINNATEFLLSKLLFNALLMILMSGISLLLFTFLLGNPMKQAWPFTGLVLLGGISLSLVFSFLAAIAAKAQQNAAIMALLGFPVIIPQLVLLMRLSSATFSPLLSVSGSAVGLLIALDALIVLMAVILFPFLWKD